MSTVTSNTSRNWNKPSGPVCNTASSRGYKLRRTAASNVHNPEGSPTRRREPARRKRSSGREAGSSHRKAEEFHQAAFGPGHFARRLSSYFRRWPRILWLLLWWRTRLGIHRDSQLLVVLNHRRHHRRRSSQIVQVNNLIGVEAERHVGIVNVREDDTFIHAGLQHSHHLPERAAGNNVRWQPLLARSLLPGLLVIRDVGLLSTRPTRSLVSEGSVVSVLEGSSNGGGSGFAMDDVASINNSISDRIVMPKNFSMKCLFIGLIYFSPTMNSFPAKPAKNKRQKSGNSS